MLKIEGDTITFTSGHTADCLCGVVGIGPDLVPSYGWDCGYDWPPSWGNLTAQDMHELAEAMIDRWEKFRVSLGSYRDGRFVAQPVNKL